MKAPDPVSRLSKLKMQGSLGFVKQDGFAAQGVH
jgi:hypothetical protein